MRAYVRAKAVVGCSGNSRLEITAKQTHGDLSSTRPTLVTAGRFKVVTLDGTVISKAGMMTGGQSGSIDRQAKAWDDQEVETLLRRKNKLTDELASLGKNRKLQVRPL